ncbi:MAG TPA: hypothetical protein VIQ31_21060 [Phormidium sp.]
MVPAFLNQPIPETLYDLYILYCEELKSKGNDGKTDPTAALRTGLLRYTIQKWGFPLPSGHKMTQDEVNTGVEFLKKIPISEVPHLLEYQQEVFESLGGKSSSRTYRLHLKRMVDWCLKQSWWQELTHSKLEQRSPRIRVKMGRVSDNVRLTNGT